MKVFVSYSSKDRATAEALAIGLRQDGHDVFFDRDALPQGEAFHARIREAIADRDLFIFLMSPASLRAQSYAQTELALARERWPDPSGRVLPVPLAPVPDADVPPYLAAVTYRPPAGNAVADVLARVAAMDRARRLKRLRRGAVAAGLALAALGGALLLRPVFGPQPDPCYLSAQVKGASPLPPGLLLDVIQPDATKSFMVSADGRSDLDLAPFAPAQTRWALELRAADGSPLARQPVDGCPDAGKTLRFAMGSDFDVTLSRR